jgi:hypothetical protein
MLKNTFKPGDKVPKLGTYWVHHYQHRQTHLAEVALSRFPECMRCDGKTRFEPVAVEDKIKPTGWLRLDPDFTATVKDIPPLPDTKSPTPTPAGNRPKLTLVKKKS